MFSASIANALSPSRLGPFGRGLPFGQPLVPSCFGFGIIVKYQYIFLDVLQRSCQFSGVVFHATFGCLVSFVRGLTYEGGAFARGGIMFIFDSLAYSVYSCFLKLRQIASFMSCLCEECSPTCASVGGLTGEHLV